MKFLNVSLILLFSFSISFAQNTNSKKILGCWALIKMEFSQPEKNSSEIIKDAINSVICFDQNGKFTTKKSKDNSVLSGKYSFSKDGNTLYENRDVQDEGVDDNAEIILLDEKHLTFKTEFGIMHFDKKL